ncbi:MAG: heavy metal translocating P-type ATPase [Verrucomicrobiae bacterium]|nr:heavy metal translocating P-type ATPase [Verrucomicrobiae bacterium]NNJ41799.1 heavy metal translocating P-type ATPase [Akkermansiaceae bacterium]
MTPDNDEGSWPLLLGSAILCGIATLAGIITQRFPDTEDLALGIYLIAYMTGGWDAALDTLEKLRKLRLDIHFLMIAVAVGAAFIGAWWEGAALLFLFSLSGALEAMAMARTEREIRSLFHDAPKKALTIFNDGSTKEVPVSSLRIGEKIRILPGDQFPTDSRVITGESSADESSLTGESLPVEKRPGDPVFSGTLNTWGRLDAEVEKVAGDSAHARIIRLITDAQQSKAPSQRFTDRFGTAYTIGILLLSLGMFLIWHFGMHLPAFISADGEKSAFYRAMTLLVVCSPCALVISIPSAILAGIASGARRGILFRGGIAVENLAQINRMAMDKTGTLTRGELELITIETNLPDTDLHLLDLAASLSLNSTHPLSRAISIEHSRRSGTRLEVTGFQSLSGKGLHGTIKGQKVTLGRRSLIFETNTNNAWLEVLAQPEAGLSEVIIHCGDLTGRLLLRDTPRSEAAQLIRQLNQQAVTTTMLTGDRAESAQRIADEVGLTDFQHGLHPEDKVAAIQSWQNHGEKVAMAGDGINDAPSLAAADVSIGMGLRGSDAVLEQADIVLTHDNLGSLLEAFTLSRRCRRVIKQNLTISLGVLVLLGIAAMGSWIPLTLGVLGHEGSTIIVVLNSMRILFASNAVVN